MRLLLVDDHPTMRACIRALLRSIPAAEVVAEAASGEEALVLARGLRPDVVLMDVCMKGMNGIEATRVIRRELPEVRVMALSHHLDVDYVLAAFRAGACGYVPKSAAGAEMESALAALERGETYFSPSIPRGDFESRALLVAKRTESLARRLRDIPALAAGARSLGEASREFITRITVEAS